MNSLTEAITLHHSDHAIPIEQLREWMHEPELRIRGAVFSIITDGWSRILPQMEMEEASHFAIQYLLDCLIENPESEDYLHSGFEAGHALAGWLKSLVTHDAAKPIIVHTAQRLADLYRQANDNTRNRIETGAVEHILELPALRPYFEFWKNDPVLKQAHAECLAWARAHEGMKW